MKIAILGYGGQGRSAYEYWNNGENEITVCDLNDSLDVPPGVQVRLGTDYLKGLDAYDMLIRTPILHPRDITAANPETPDILQKVTTVTNEFLRVSPSRNIIGVTGTKGKGTTSTLVAKMLHAAGKRVHLGGNIGLPPLDMLHGDGYLGADDDRAVQPDDWVVLELANFQLIDLKLSPRIATCLMVVPEHLDWHTDFDEYVHTKGQLFRWQTPNDIAVYYADNETSKRVVDHGKGQKIPYFATPGAIVRDGKIVIDNHDIRSVNDLKLLGKHNWQNACAAITTAWQVTQDVSAIRSTLTSFSGLEHRLEFVREHEGVSYYDDSFGTTPETTIVAIEAFDTPKVVILGGSDKKASYEKLAQTIVSSNVRAAILIGETAPAIQSALHTAGFTATYAGGETMQQIVDEAKKHAHNGDLVLLSTGCASFGLFKNYKDRGEQFKAAVQALA